MPRRRPVKGARASNAKPSVLLEDYDEDADDDEVFALKGMDDSDEDEDGQYAYEDEDMKELEEAPQAKKKRSKKAKAKGKKKGITVESSEEDEEQTSEDETWGRSKAAYVTSAADQLDSDDEEALELHEQEARRLQAKARAEMVEADFGLEDLPEHRAEQKEELEELKPPPVASLPQDKKSLMRHLEKSNPEALALARDWEETAVSLMKAHDRLAMLEAERPEAFRLGIIHLHYQTLLTYTTTLAFFLHLRSSEKYAQRPELLQSHPIMNRLLILKQSLTTMEDFNFTGSDDDDDDDDDDDEVSDDLSEDLDFASIFSAFLPSTSQKTINGLPPKKKRKVAQKPIAAASPPTPLFDLEEPVFRSSKSTHTAPSAPGPGTSEWADLADPYGDATALPRAAAQSKAARRRSLRFHAWRVESAGARRRGARERAAGGDDDLPYREWAREREARLARVAEGGRGGGEDLDEVGGGSGSGSGDSDSDGGDDAPLAHSVRGKRRRLDSDGGDADEYYELVKRQTQERKERRKAEHDEARAAARLERTVGGISDGSGPRALTRAIIANKGLTPRRPKSVRNPRVRKRLRYEQAQKRVASQKPVHRRGAVDATRYEGEKSGITRVVKSVRFA